MAGSTGATTRGSRQTMSTKSNRIASSVDAEIRKHRAADVTLTIRRLGGAPLANDQVVIAQRTHKFPFGGIGHAAIALANGQLQRARARRGSMRQAPGASQPHHA